MRSSAVQEASALPGMTRRSPFCYVETSPDVIHLAVMLDVRSPLSLRNVADLPRERVCLGWKPR